MNNEKYQNKGLTGLANLGNTCFVNSCIQILSHTYELNDFLNLQTYKKKLNKKHESVLLLEWDNLRTLMWSENCIVSPGKFIGIIQRVAQIKKIDIFTGYAQNDLPEFLLFIIDCFHTSLAREVNMSISGTSVNNVDDMAIQCFNMIKNMYSKEYSEIWNMFYGIHVSQIISLETGEALSTTPEPYFMINLPIPPPDNKTPSLSDCLDLYVKGEVLDGDNAWYNEKTLQKQNVQKQISYWSLPSILVIDLKRFNAQNRKNQILVSFPLENFDLSKYVVGYKKENYIYDLYGICNHSGGVHGGHYSAFIKNANGKWYEFNDTLVKEVVDLNQLISPKAYCFFYRKKPIVLDLL
jgi:ubiquitin carboxyl-terminal hydrolase 8